MKSDMDDQILDYHWIKNNAFWDATLLDIAVGLGWNLVLYYKKIDFIQIETRYYYHGLLLLFHTLSTNYN